MKQQPPLIFLFTLQALWGKLLLQLPVHTVHGILKLSQIIMKIYDTDNNKKHSNEEKKPNENKTKQQPKK